MNYTGPDGPHQVDNIPEDATSVELATGIQPCFNYTIELFAVNAVGESTPAVLHWVVRSTGTFVCPMHLGIILIQLIILTDLLDSFGFRNMRCDICLLIFQPENESTQ